jgi:hypothetical protein
VDEVKTKYLAFFSFLCLNGRDYAKALMSSQDPFATTQGIDELGLPQKVLESLFNIRQNPKHESKTTSWRNVAKKMQSLGIDASSSSGEEPHPNTFGTLLWFLDFSICVYSCK